jgi:hypothetical protein
MVEERQTIFSIEELQSKWEEMKRYAVDGNELRDLILDIDDLPECDEKDELLKETESHLQWLLDNDYPGEQYV